MTNFSWPRLGCGVGLRSQHYPVVTETWPQMDWFEAISENYMDTGGRPLHILEKVRQHYPIALHGTALSIGSVDPLNQNYLERLKKLIARIDPFIVSDHLCWSGAVGETLHDLLPLPFTEEAVQHVAGRVGQVQEYLGRPILLENVSTYVTYRHSTMPEWEFLSEVSKRSGCGILLDLNNLYVNSVNHRFDPYEYLKNIPGERVGQFHLAGHTDMGTYLFDTHSAPVIEAVWALYREALRLFGPVSTLIEWDENIPPYEQLAEEVKRARRIYRKYEGGPPAASSLRGNVPSVIASPALRGEAIPWGRDKLLRSSFFEIASASSGTQSRNDKQISTSLSEIQQWFKSKVQPALCPSSQPLPLRAILNPQGGVAGEERISVYANGYFARIAESLKEAYEAIHQVTGPKKFSELCESYARRYPSHSYNLNYAGKYLPELLEKSSVTKDFPFLPDLAHLEWLLWEAFHAFDETPLDSSQIKGIAPEDWENCRIVFQPSVGLFASRWTLLEVWLNRNRPVADLSPEKLNRPQRILVGRKGDQVRCEPLDENQYKLLGGLLAGKNLGNVCDELAETAEEENLPITEWFSRWVHDGLILRLDFSKTPHAVA